MPIGKMAIAMSLFYHQDMVFIMPEYYPLSSQNNIFLLTGPFISLQLKKLGRGIMASPRMSGRLTTFHFWSSSRKLMISFILHTYIS